MAEKRARRKIRSAIYPGSFDPVTNGHLALIQKAAQLFDYVNVAVGTNTSKSCTFSAEERMEMLQHATKSHRNVEVTSFEGLVVDYAQKQGINIILRGLRAVSDYELELQMALTNRKLNPDIETIFLLPSVDYFYISSGLIKEIARLGGRISDFVPPEVERSVRKHFGPRQSD